MPQTPFEILKDKNIKLVPDKSVKKILTKPIKKPKPVLEAHYSNKGRNGKEVTIIKGLTDIDEIRRLSKFLKKTLNVGGSIKNNELIIQGGYRNEIIDLLTKKSYKIKRIGG